MMTNKRAVLLVQLGSPRSAKPKDVRSYLRKFLSDPRVVDLPAFLWFPILYLFVLPTRTGRSAQAYARILTKDGFPLVFFTERFAMKVKKYLQGDFMVEYAFILGEPSISRVWRRLLDQEVQEITIVPLFPQYSESTTASVMDRITDEIRKTACLPKLTFMTEFYDSKAFIDSSVRQIKKYWRQFNETSTVDLLVISFHGMPKRRIISKKDPYYRHCYATFMLLQAGLGLTPDLLKMTFQSRFGGEEWLTPYTDEFVIQKVRAGQQRVAVYCASFVVDCLETIDEIGHELACKVKPWGGEILLIPALGDDQIWCEQFSSHLKKPSLYEVDPSLLKRIPELKMQSPPLSVQAKSTLKIVFLTLFLDLVGFSIIFPLFPALAKHYLTTDEFNSWIQMIFVLIGSWADLGAAGKGSVIVLFGGALGALYSLLQFLTAPFWGVLSDRIGRRPVLLISIAGLAFSYFLWFFAASFGILLLARFIGGVMGGNISTATAVVADVTQKENRAKGMAFIGIAFALGFVLGPALGGILSLIDLTQIYPSLAQYGVNPFSMPAALAFILSLFNFIWLARKFKETLPPEKRGKSVTARSSNPLTLFKPLPFAGVNLTNIGHFFFLTAFSGMEFTLTFLAVERLGYTSFDNASMFVFIGILIAITQGGIVRRYAHQVGEKKMALYGLIILIPGLLSIAFAHHTFVLYMGLFFLSIGSAMAISCLTSLVSLYSPADQQGKSIGIFRSLGALARVVGPVVASVIYWRMGESWPYIAGAIFLIIPILLVAKLPRDEGRPKN